MSSPIRVVAGVMEGHEPGHVLVFRRAPDSSHGGRWEFPGGKVEAGESDAEALRRELREELELEVQVGSHLWTGARPGLPPLEIAFYEATPVNGTISLSVHDRSASVDPRTGSDLNWAEVDAAFVRWLIERGS